MLPWALPPNRFEHTYAGGAAITELRGVPVDSTRYPEEWVGSTTARFHRAPEGLSRTADGAFLRDVIAADPQMWLGSEHFAEFGTDSGVLLKLLDAGQRLPVHLHPTNDFASRHLGCRFGKSESWFILAAPPGALVYLGLRRAVSPARLRELVTRQDVDTLLDCLHPVEVRPGDSVFVPAGLPHAIGPGIFIAETQQPTDFSIMLEWGGRTTPPPEILLDLGLERALSAVTLDELPPGGVAALRAHVGAGVQSATPLRVLVEAADAYFRVDLVRPPEGQAVLAPGGYGVWIVLDGHGQVRSAAGETAALARGAVFAAPHASGPLEVSGAVSVFVARPPRPDAHA